MLDPRMPMTASDTAILEYAVELHMPIHTLAWPEGRFVSWLLKTWHGRTREELAARMGRLVDAGHIAIFGLTGDRLWPSPEGIRAILVPRRLRYPCVVYGLTEKGGTRWEVAARPNWDRFHQVDGAEDEYWIEAASPLNLQRAYIQTVCDSWLRVMRGSERWSVLQPWKATYWKTLPVGYRLRFNHEGSFESQEDFMHYHFRGWSDNEIRDVYRSIGDWRRYFGNWHTRGTGVKA